MRRTHPLSRLSDLSDVTAKTALRQPADVLTIFDRCDSCGQLFDLRNVREVAHHELPGHQPAVARANLRPRSETPGQTGGTAPMSKCH
jgi:hypothetical protein